MKRKTTLLKISSVLIASGLSAGSSFMASTLHAQSSTDEKVRLYSAAISARDSGDFEAAKKYLEELLKISPGDKYIENDLADVKKQLTSLKPVKTTTVAATPQQATVEVSDKGIVVVDPDKKSDKASEKKVAEAERKKELGLPTEKVSDETSDELMAGKVSNDDEVLKDAQEAIKASRRLRNQHKYDEALAFLNEAKGRLPNNTATRRTHDAIQFEIGQIQMERAQLALDKNDPESTQAYLDDYRAATSEISESSKKVSTSDRKAQQMEEQMQDPFRQDPEKVSPEYTASQKKVKELLKKGRAQYIQGDLFGARETFKQVTLIDANNNTAKWYYAHIARKMTSRQAYDNTRSELLLGVTKAWELPNVYQTEVIVDAGPRETELEKRLKEIIIPEVNFRGTKLSLVVETLSELSRSADTDGKGVNIIFVNSGSEDPTITVQLRELSLDRMLANITRSVDYQYQATSDVVEVRKGSPISNLETKRFDMPATILMKIAPKLASSGGGFSSTSSSNPFDSAPAASSGGGGNADHETEIINFLKRSGVDFDSTKGASLAYAGDAILVTQSSNNLTRIANILSQFSVEQVEIEAKFIDVIDSKLQELGFNWRATKGNSRVFQTYGVDAAGNPTNTNIRSLNDAFGGAGSATPGSINRTIIEQNEDGTGYKETALAPVPIANSVPQIPNPVPIAANAVMTGLANFGIGNWDISVMINALEQSEGADTLSAPKVTVISGNPAKITVAQEFPYPTSWTEGEVDPGSGGSGSGTTISSTIGINPATPQEFTTRNVGVELEVTPKVDSGTSTITLDNLTPTVTEFEGFVEYGGRSVAMNASTIVDVPSGIIYPVFSVRKVQTNVVVSDGATIVLGGLTREQTRIVHDKVPILGDIPFVGRFFRSKGESSMKRNLLVFVTANQVGPGGAPVRKDSMTNVKPGSNYVNTTITTPSGVVPRTAAADSTK